MDNKQFLRIHGYVNSSDSENNCDSDVEHLYNVLKPPPIVINDTKTVIVKIKGTAPKNETVLIKTPPRDSSSKSVASKNHESVQIATSIENNSKKASKTAEPPKVAKVSKKQKRRERASQKVKIMKPLIKLPPKKRLKKYQLYPLMKFMYLLLTLRHDKYDRCKCYIQNYVKRPDDNFYSYKKSSCLCRSTAFKEPLRKKKANKKQCRYPRSEHSHKKKRRRHKTRFMSKYASYENSFWHAKTPVFKYIRSHEQKAIEDKIVPDFYKKLIEKARRKKVRVKKIETLKNGNENQEHIDGILNKKLKFKETSSNEEWDEVKITVDDIKVNSKCKNVPRMDKVKRRKKNKSPIDEEIEQTDDIIADIYYSPKDDYVYDFNLHNYNNVGSKLNLITAEEKQQYEFSMKTEEKKGTTNTQPEDLLLKDLIEKFVRFFHHLDNDEYISYKSSLRSFLLTHKINRLIGRMLRSNNWHCKDSLTFDDLKRLFFLPLLRNRTIGKTSLSSFLRKRRFRPKAKLRVLKVVRPSGVTRKKAKKCKQKVNTQTKGKSTNDIKQQQEKTRKTEEPPIKIVEVENVVKINPVTLQEVVVVIPNKTEENLGSGYSEKMLNDRNEEEKQKVHAEIEDTSNASIKNNLESSTCSFEESNKNQIIHSVKVVEVSKNDLEKQPVTKIESVPCDLIFEEEKTTEGTNLNKISLERTKRRTNTCSSSTFDKDFVTYGNGEEIQLTLEPFLAYYENNYNTLYECGSCEKNTAKIEVNLSGVKKAKKKKSKKKKLGDVINEEKTLESLLPTLDKSEEFDSDQILKKWAQKCTPEEIGYFSYNYNLPLSNENFNPPKSENGEEARANISKTEEYYLKNSDAQFNPMPYEFGSFENKTEKEEVDLSEVKKTKKKRTKKKKQGEVTNEKKTQEILLPSLDESERSDFDEILKKWTQKCTPEEISYFSYNYNLPLMNGSFDLSENGEAQANISKNELCSVKNIDKYELDLDEVEKTKKKKKQRWKIMKNKIVNDQDKLEIHNYADEKILDNSTNDDKKSKCSVDETSCDINVKLKTEAREETNFDNGDNNKNTDSTANYNVNQEVFNEDDFRLFVERTIKCISAFQEFILSPCFKENLNDGEIKIESQTPKVKKKKKPDEKYVNEIVNCDIGSDDKSSNILGPTQEHVVCCDFPCANATENKHFVVADRRSITEEISLILDEIIGKISDNPSTTKKSKKKKSKKKASDEILKETLNNETKIEKTLLPMNSEVLCITEIVINEADDVSVYKKKKKKALKKDAREENVVNENKCDVKNDEVDVITTDLQQFNEIDTKLSVLKAKKTQSKNVSLINTKEFNNAGEVIAENEIDTNNTKIHIDKTMSVEKATTSTNPDENKSVSNKNKYFFDIPRTDDNDEDLKNIPLELFALHLKNKSSLKSIKKLVESHHDSKLEEKPCYSETKSEVANNSSTQNSKKTKTVSADNEDNLKQSAKRSKKTSDVVNSNSTGNKQNFPNGEPKSASKKTVLKASDCAISSSSSSKRTVQSEVNVNVQSQNVTGEPSCGTKSKTKRKKKKAKSNPFLEAIIKFDKKE